MVKTKEQKVVFSIPEGAKIIKANLNISDDGKSVEFIITMEEVQEQQPAVVNTENLDEVFPIIDPSELVGHKLLQYEPTFLYERRLLADILKGLELKLPAFRAPFMDPSEEEGKIVFKPGNKPAVGHSTVWWDETWKKFMPSKNSRSGTELHWAAFLGKKMKYLVEKKNYSVEDAWKAVCGDSCDLGHYYNSKDAKHKFEITGSRKVGAFFDLANACKILKKWDASGFWIAGGYYLFFSFQYPLAHLRTVNYPEDDLSHSVGWLVLDV